MKFKLTRGSSWEWSETREINTLEELLALMEEFGHDLVVSHKFGIGEEDYAYRITIYDDYLE
jgi:hypothetical protein